MLIAHSYSHPKTIPEKSFDVNEVLPYTSYFDDATLDTIVPINSQDLNPEEMMKYVLNASSQELSTLDDVQNYAAHREYTPDLLHVDLGCNFDVTMKGDSNSWVLSAGKVFIKMFSAMTINVSYSPQPETLYLRAMVLFDNPNEMHLPVKMCANHAANVSSSSNMTGIPKHILKCLTPNAFYEGNEDGILFKERLSVVVQLQNCKRDEEGNVSEPIVYDFQCQNSCASGINRKSTSIVFTLEDQHYKILGKRVLPFKVCSCPKRDAEREQTDNNKRKLTGNEPFPKGKRPKYAPRNTQLDVKIEPEDSDAAEDADTPKLVDFLIKIPSNCCKYMAECAFNKMTGMMATQPEKHTELYRKCAREIRKIQESFEDK